MIFRPASVFFTLISFFNVFLCQLCQAELSRTVPDIYYEKLEALLTPLEVVLDKEDIFADSNEPGTVLLREELHYVYEDGRKIRVLHQVYKSSHYTTKNKC